MLERATNNLDMTEARDKFFQNMVELRDKYNALSVHESLEEQRVSRFVQPLSEAFVHAWKPIPSQKRIEDLEAQIINLKSTAVMMNQLIERSEARIVRLEDKLEKYIFGDKK